MAVYLLHFDRPIAPGRHTTQHYLGYADILNDRLTQHRKNPDARLLQVAKERRIGFQLVRVWQGDRKLEKKLKRWKNSPKLCPICRARRK